MEEAFKQAEASAARRKSLGGRPSKDDPAMAHAPVPSEHFHLSDKTPPSAAPDAATLRSRRDVDLSVSVESPPKYLGAAGGGAVSLTGRHDFSNVAVGSCCATLAAAQAAASEAAAFLARSFAVAQTQPAEIAIVAKEPRSRAFEGRPLRARKAADGRDRVGCALKLPSLPKDLQEERARRRDTVMRRMVWPRDGGLGQV